MSAFLYLWNPRKWEWVDRADAVRRVTAGEPYDIYWGCGNTKGIEIGDMFFLMRVGVEPKGIIGCGYVCSKPYPLPHWDPARAEAGDTQLRTDLLFKVRRVRTFFVRTVFPPMQKAVRALRKRTHRTDYNSGK